MTPAEKLAKKKPWMRGKRNGPPHPRRVVWICRVREVRESLRISIKDVAKALGMSISGLWQIEMGSDPMLTTVRMLCAFFGKTEMELWPEKRRKASRGS